jgi:hypothetical protein
VANSPAALIGTQNVTEHTTVAPNGLDAWRSFDTGLNCQWIETFELVDLDFEWIPEYSFDGGGEWWENIHPLGGANPSERSAQTTASSAPPVELIGVATMFDAPAFA